VLRAQIALLQAQWTIRFRRRGTLLSGMAGDSTPSVGDPGRLPRARELAIAVRRAAEHGPFRAHCLARAIATTTLFRREGLSGAVIRLGVKIRDGRFMAHAWVEYAGTMLIDSDAEVADMHELDGLRINAVE
jgi:hypothetical protein